MTPSPDALKKAREITYGFDNESLTLAIAAALDAIASAATEEAAALRAALTIARANAEIAAADARKAVIGEIEVEAEIRDRHSGKTGTGGSLRALAALLRARSLTKGTEDAGT